MLKQIKNNIEKSIASFLKEVSLSYQFPKIAPELYLALKEYSLREGKRIRPTLFLLSYLGYAKKNRHLNSLYHASIGIEFLHNFMLIHDDIIDNSDLRRGKPTLHKILSRTIVSHDPQKLGNDLAIIAGDIIYALALEAFSSIKAPQKNKDAALKYFIQTTTFTALGEYVDTINGLKNLSQVTEKDVFINYNLKTARYTFASPLVLGAILAGAKNEEIKKLYQFGILIGEAFQIQDDIIGIFGSEKMIGKSILSDLQENKKTILVTHAYQNLNPKELKIFKTIFNKPTKKLEDLARIKKLFIDAGSLAYSLKAVQSRINQALKISAQLSMKRKYLTLIKDATFEFFKQTNAIATENHITLR